MIGTYCKFGILTSCCGKRRIKLSVLTSGSGERRTQFGVLNER